MNYNRPINPDDEPEEPVGEYRLADEPPPERPPMPVRDDPLLDEKPRRRKRRDDNEELDDDHDPGATEPLVPRRRRSDILERPDEAPKYPWWMGSAIAAGIGYVLCMVPIGVIGSQMGAGTAVVAIIITAIAVVVQVAMVTMFLMMLGHFFGIDYGPAVEAITKLAAVVLVVDGFTGVFMLCSPCGLILAALIGCAVFQYLFKLSVFEMLLSVAGMVAASWILNAAVVSIVAKKRIDKAAPPPTALLVAPRFTNTERS